MCKCNAGTFVSAESAVEPSSAIMVNEMAVGSSGCPFVSQRYQRLVNTSALGRTNPRSGAALLDSPSPAKKQRNSASAGRKHFAGTSRCGKRVRFSPKGKARERFFSYQTSHRSAGARTIAESFLQPNASAKAGKFDSGP